MAIDRMQEFARGWRTLVVAGVGSAVSAAGLVSFTLGAFILPLSQTFGWSRAQLGGLALGQSVGLLIVSVVIGAVVDRFGVRRTVLVSQPLLALGFFGMALLPGEIWAFYVGYMMLLVLGAGTLTIVWTRVLVDWFERARGLALGAALMFTGLFGSVTPLYVTWLTTHYDWRAGYIGLGLLPLVLGMPISWFLLSDKPPLTDDAVTGVVRSQEPGVTLGEALRSPRFRQLAFAYFIGTVGTYGAMMHALPMLVDRGVDPVVAASVAGLFGLAVSAGRLGTGALMDHFCPEWVASLMFVVPAIACMILILASDSLALCTLAVLLIGLGTGAEGDSTAYLVARYFGRRHYGALYGSAFAISLLGGGIGPILAGRSYDETHSYDLALMGGIGLFLLAAWLLFDLRPRGPKPAEIPLSVVHTTS